MHDFAADVPIRRADANDATEIEAIVQDAYAIYVPRIGRKPAPMTADYPRLIEGGDVWVAEAGEDIAGVLVVRPQKSSLFLENVAVAPRRQGTGVGRALIEFAEARARELGLSEVTLYTNERMTENLRLYPSLGYRETGRRQEEGFARVFFAKRVA